MSQETIATSLLAMRRQAEEIAHNIDHLHSDICTKRQELRQVVDEYTGQRIELFKETLNARGMMWCTYCLALFPKDKTELLLVEGREEYSHGYGDAFYGFRGFSKLHRACPTCRERAADKHGLIGPYDSQAKDQERFYVFRVEEREDGYYACKFGTWVKLKDDKYRYRIDEPTNELVNRFARVLDLPPRMEVGSTWSNSDGMLIIHEQSAVVEAA